MWALSQLNVKDLAGQSFCVCTVWTLICLLNTPRVLEPLPDPGAAEGRHGSFLTDFRFWWKVPLSPRSAALGSHDCFVLRGHPQKCSLPCLCPLRPDLVSCPQRELQEIGSCPGLLDPSIWIKWFCWNKALPGLSLLSQHTEVWASSQEWTRSPAVLLILSSPTRPSGFPPRVPAAFPHGNLYTCVLRVTWWRQLCRVWGRAVP